MLTGSLLEELFDLLGDVAVVLAVFQAGHGVVEELASQELLQLRDAGESKRLCAIRRRCFFIGRLGRRVGQQEVSDQHEMQVLFDASAL